MNKNHLIVILPVITQNYSPNFILIRGGVTKAYLHKVQIQYYVSFLKIQFKPDEVAYT